VRGASGPSAGRVRPVVFSPLALPDVDTGVAKARGVLAVAARDAADFVHAEFLALVEVRGAGECEVGERRGAGRTQAEVPAQVVLGPVDEQPSAASLARGRVLGVAADRGRCVSGRMPGDVMVRECPRRRVPGLLR
jgi:hypothetical protein